MHINTTTQEEVQAVEELKNLKAWDDIENGVCCDLTETTLPEVYEEVFYMRELYDSFKQDFDDGLVGGPVFQKYPASEIFDEVQAWLDKYANLCME